MSDIYKPKNYMKKASMLIVPVNKPTDTHKYKKLAKQLYKQFKCIFRNSNNFENRFKSLLVTIIDTLHGATINHDYVRNFKFTTLEIVGELIDVISNETYWNRHNGLIDGKYLNKLHNKYQKLGVYDLLYRIILIGYFGERKFEKLKYQSIDTTFIRNLYGAEIYGPHPEYKFKNSIKVSCITDSNRVPIAIAVGSSNNSDTEFVNSNLDNMFIDPETGRVANNNKYKQYFNGDTGYDSRSIIKKIKAKKYIPIIPRNKRNTKDETILNDIEKHNQKISKQYKERHIIENAFSHLHKFPKLNRLVEKTISSYSGLLLLGFSLTVFKKTINSIDE
jgi:hypothetical protein